MEAKLTRPNYNVDKVQSLISQGIAQIEELRNMLNTKRLGEIRKDVCSIYPKKSFLATIRFEPPDVLNL